MFLLTSLNFINSHSPKYDYKPLSQTLGLIKGNVW